MDIIYILEDIADELHISSSITKLVYVVFIESTQEGQLNTRMIDFLPKQMTKQIIGELQERLAQLKNI